MSDKLNSIIIERPKPSTTVAGKPVNPCAALVVDMVIPAIISSKIETVSHQNIDVTLLSITANNGDGSSKTLYISKMSWPGFLADIARAMRNAGVSVVISNCENGPEPILVRIMEGDGPAERRYKPAAAHRQEGPTNHHPRRPPPLRSNPKDDERKQGLRGGTGGVHEPLIPIPDEEIQPQETGVEPA